MVGSDVLGMGGRMEGGDAFQGGMSWAAGRLSDWPSPDRSNLLR